MPDISDNWKKSIIRELDVVENVNTIYLRYLKTFENIYDYTAVFIRISHVSGIVLYINGKEYYRRNVMDGNLDENSKATSKFGELTNIKFVLPINIFDKVTNSISIELHRYPGESSFPQFKMFAMELEGDDDENGCEFMNLYAEPITDQSQTDVGKNVASYGFDTLESTIWKFNSTPSYAIIKFNENVHIYFNQFTIIGYGESDSNEIQEVTLSTKENGMYKDLAVFKDIVFPNGKNVLIYPNYSTPSSYESIKITISKPENQQVAVRDFLFNLCPIRYCNAIPEYNIPRTISGTTINVKCLVPSNENKVLLCPNGKNPEWKELSNNCQEIPEIVSYKSNYSFEVGKDYNDISLFSISGPKITYSISKEIKGLLLNSSTGLLSGIPYEEMKETSIIFKAVNPFNTEGVSVTIKISITPATQPRFLNVTDRITVIAGMKIKDLVLFNVVGRNLKFLISTMPYGLFFNETKKALYGVAQLDGHYYTKFDVSNENGTDNCVVYIEVLYPNKPIVIKVNSYKWYYYEDYVIFPVQCVGNNLKYTTSSLLPNGLELIESSGVLQGKLTSPASNKYPVIISCSNVNGSASGEIMINVENPPYPILISHQNEVVLEGGKEYVNYQICNVSGSNLTYSLITSLPDKLKIDKKRGTIEGYALKEYDNIKYTVMINGGDKVTNFVFILQVKIKEKASIVESTVVYSHSFEAGKIIEGFKLFEAIGTNIHITVEPELPLGIFCNSNTAIIYGSIKEIVEGKNYTFIVNNPPSPDVVKRVIYLEFNIVKCDKDSGFPNTIAEIGGNSVSIQCEKGYDGIKTRVCYYTDAEPVWSSIRSDCRINGSKIAAIVVGVVVTVVIVCCISIYCILRSGIIGKKIKLHKLPKNKNDDGVRI